LLEFSEKMVEDFKIYVYNQTKYNPRVTGVKLKQNAPPIFQHKKLPHFIKMREVVLEELRKDPNWKVRLQEEEQLRKERDIRYKNLRIQNEKERVLQKKQLQQDPNCFQQKKLAAELQKNLGKSYFSYQLFM